MQYIIQQSISYYCSRMRFSPFKNDFKLLTYDLLYETDIFVTVAEKVVYLLPKAMSRNLFGNHTLRVALPLIS